MVKLGPVSELTLVDVAHVSRTSSPRAAPVDRVEAGLREGGVDDVRAYGSVREAVEAARRAATEDDLVLVTGSFYTVADARRMLVGG